MNDKEIKEMKEMLVLMTSLVRLKYGNSDKDVYSLVEKAEEMVKS